MTRLGGRLLASAAAVVLLLATGGQAVRAASSPRLVDAIDPTPERVTLPGSPLGIQPTPDGKTVFVALAGSVLTGPAAGGMQIDTVEGIAILSQGSSSARLVRVIDQSAAIAGLALTPDAHYLLAAYQPDGQATDGVQVIDVRQALAGASDPVVATVLTGPGSGPALVQMSKDGRYAFVSDELSQNEQVIDVATAIATGGGVGSIKATVQLGGDLVPVGEDISPDGRYLYLTNEESLAVGGSPTACGTLPDGSLAVLSTAELEAGAADPYVARVSAGCEPVRVESSADGRVLWVSSRSSDAVVAYDAAKLLTDPAHAVISTTPVGSQPVGLQLFDSGRLLAVTNSNRSATPPDGTFSVLSTASALAGGGRAATLLNQPAGEFPRQLALSPDGTKLYLGEYDSNVLEIFRVTPTATTAQTVSPARATSSSTPTSTAAGTGDLAFTGGSPWLPASALGLLALAAAVRVGRRRSDPPR